MQVLDTLTNKLGRGIVKVASSRTKQDWKMKREQLSACYTTSLEDVIVVKA